jgi:peptidyl-tRNA hydrolase
VTDDRGKLAATAWELTLKRLSRISNTINPDRRPEWEKQRERKFILAVNSLKTLRVRPEGSMSIDPEEIRAQVLESRERLKHFVHRR